MKRANQAFLVVDMVVDIFFYVLEILLVLRFFMKLLGANTHNVFVSWIYDLSQPLLVIFQGIFRNVTLKEQYLVEFNTLFALFVYSILYMLILKGLELIFETGEVVTKKENKK